MDREHSGDERACPHRSRHFFQGKKKQDCGDTVQQHIDEVMPAGLEPEQLAIQHVRDGGERMPVLRMNVGERPTNTMPA